jgi:hypothetical protein
MRNVGASHSAAVPYPLVDRAPLAPRWTNRLIGLLLGTLVSSTAAVASAQTAPSSPDAATRRATAVEPAQLSPFGGQVPPTVGQAVPTDASAMRVTVDAKAAKITGSFSALFDAAVDTKLRSGITNIIAFRVYVARQRDNRPIAVAVRTCKVHFDLWDEVFHVHIASNGAEHDLAALTVDAVHRQCGELREFTIALPVPLAPSEQYYAAVVAEANPISAEQVDAMKRWAAQPAGVAPQASTEVLFGAFVGLFIRPRLQADRELRRRSRPFAGVSTSDASGR